MNFKKITIIIKKLFSDYLALSFSLVLLLILINLIIIPMYKKISDLRNQIAIEKNELETKYIRRQTIRRTLLSLQHTKEDWPKLYNSFHPEFGQEVAFIKTMEQTADNFKLSQDIRLEPTLASPLSADIQIVPMQLTLIGNFANIVSLINALENKSFIMQLKDFKMSRMSPDGTVRADLRYDTYWHNK